MILITGGMGFLGSSTAKILCEQGRNVLLAVHKQAELAPFLQPYQGKNLFTTPLDVTDLEVLEQVIKKYDVKSILHAAAVYEGKGTLYDAMRVNVLGTINVLEASARNGISRVSCVSSEAVYQGIKQMEPLREDQLISLESDRYIPATKKAEEHVAMIYAAKQGLDLVLIRASRIYGPLFMPTRSPINLMLQAAIQGKVGEFRHIDENEGHDNIYVKDCARGIVLLHTAQKLKHRTYNLGMGQLTTFGQIRDAVIKTLPEASILLGKNLGAVTPTKTPLDINACLDITRIQAELGFNPEYDIEGGIRANITWLRDKQYI